MRTRAAVAAGVVDAGLASLATFAAGIFAVRALEPRTLGGYALAFAAFALLAVVPAHLRFLPAEVAAVALPRGERLALLAPSLRAGAPAAAAAALLLPAWVLAAPPGLAPADAVALTATAAACALLSPVQDHVRRMLHVAGRSRTAAAVSGVQLAVVAGVIAGWAAGAVPLPAPWLPFGALAAANAVSSAAGLVLGRAPRAAPPPALHPRALAATGRWLLVVGLVAPASSFAAASVVGRLAGAEALGLAEAARIVGQPVVVLATGLAAVLGPRATEAARLRRRGEARRIERAFAALVAAAAVLYALAVGWPSPVNPLARLVPHAYAVPGLALAAIAAAAVNGALFTARAELLGHGRAPSLARTDAGGAAVRIGVAATAGASGAFALPLGFLALGALRWIGYRRALAAACASPDPSPGGAVDPRPRAADPHPTRGAEMTRSHVHAPSHRRILERGSCHPERGRGRNRRKRSARRPSEGSSRSTVRGRIRARSPAPLTGEQILRSRRPVERQPVGRAAPSG